MVALPGLLMRQCVVSDVILVSLLSPLFWSCFENGGMLPWESCCCVSSVVQFCYDEDNEGKLICPIWRLPSKVSMREMIIWGAA